MAQAFDIDQEAKSLGVTLEQDGDEWLAFLPTTSEGQDLGFPAPSEEEALDEIRAYRAIEASPLYEFEYVEAKDAYVVRFGDQSVEDKLLAVAYRAAQRAYAESVSAPPPEPEPIPLPPLPKTRKPRAPKASPEPVEPTSEPAPAPASPELAPGYPQATSTLAFVADILNDVAEILRKRGAPS